MIFNHDSTVGWDGTYGGQKVQQGTYTWTIDTKAILNDEGLQYSGHLNLLIFD